MSSFDPGLDRHEWETEYASLEAQLEEAPAEALPDLADLVERMLGERGIDVGADGDARELVAEFRSAREHSDRAERGEADPGDVGAAIVSLRTVYESLIAERGAP